MKLRQISPRIAAFFVAAIMPIVPSVAGDIVKPLGVVELFTSQGCNSCPPADRVLADLSKSGEVVTLGYHVDYWDYLGWKDTLGSTQNTARQYDYGKSFGSRSVYTPQAVVNGRTHVNGANKAAVSGTLSTLQKSGQGMSVGITVTRSGESVMIDADGATSGAGNAHVVLVYFDPVRQIEIERGENRGKVIDYVNPVTDIETAGMWHGKPARFELPANEIAKKGGCAVLLQSVSKDGLPGPILGAAVIRKPLK